MLDKVLEQYRRFYWVANGLLVLAIAYTLAGIGVRFAVDLIPVPAPKPRASAAPVKQQAPATMADYQVILARNLLNAKVEEAPPPVDPKTAAPVAATIQAALLGTVAGPAKYAFAVVQAQGKNEVVRIGEKIAGSAEVLEIHRGRIVILNNGRKEELSMYDEKALPGNAEPSRPEPAMLTPTPSGPPVAEGQPEVDVRQTSDTSFELDRNDFEQVTQNLGPLLTQARVVPHFENGAINGYKIFAIKPDSLYQKIGLENGDVIQNINGIQVDSPEKALQMFQSLRTEKNFTINLSRNNTAMQFHYNLR